MNKFTPIEKLQSKADILLEEIDALQKQHNPDEYIRWLIKNKLQTLDALIMESQVLMKHLL